MRRIHSFKAGSQTASNGTTIVFTENDLWAIAAAYSPDVSEAPIVVGHPTTDGPAYGWVKSFTAQGPNLFAEPHQVNPEFAELVKAGAFKKVSISLYPKDHPHNPVPGVYYPRHLGYLGATPPAIKGLKPTEFAAADAECIELELAFSDAPEQTPEPSSLPPVIEAAKGGTDGSPEGSATSPPEPTTVTPEEKAALEAHNTQLQADLSAARATLQAQASAATTAAHSAFAETLVTEARITEADKALITAALDHLEPAVLPGAQAPALVEFGEGDAKKPMAEALKDWLKALPKRVEFGEQAGRDRAALQQPPHPEGVSYAEGTPAETIELDKRIRAYASEHKLGYGEAALAVAMRR